MEHRADLRRPDQAPLGLAFLEIDSARPRSVVRNLSISLVLHLCLGLVLWSLPEVARSSRAPVVVADIRKAVKLVAPRLPKSTPELTQKDPNIGKPSKSIDVRSAVSVPQPAIPRIPSPPPTPVPTQAPVIEPPKIEVALNSGMPQGGTSLPVPPAPPQQTEKPKLAFESVTSASVQSRSPNAALTPRRNSVEDLTRGASQPQGGGMSVGDELGPAPDIGLPGQAPVPGRMGSNLQLLSDTAGVDFKPYLIQVLAAVRHNWMSVVPESARLGRKGVVLVQFIINREGNVPKLVIASPSGTAALDRAAVAGVSMSHPFPPLPVGYKGDEVRLQLAFSYNMSK